MSLIAELRRRKLVQWALAYAAGAWAVLQALSLLISVYHWPDAVLRIAIVVVVIGFLVTLVLAWYHGEHGAQRLSRNEMLWLALLLALGSGLAWRTAHAPVSTASNAVVLQPIAAATAVAPKKSIAVLPFVNMSADKDNEYFSDGMSEEILNALAKVKDLKVAGRTSSFYYKGRNEDLRSIGKALGVANVLEGSVRKQGEKVRITAQLIRTDDDFHLWSETYDGDLKDVFALQESIARAITNALSVVLSSKQAERLVNAGTENPEAYSLYLQAASIFNRRDSEHYEDAIAALNKAVELDPKFARAYSRLAVFYAALASTSSETLRSLQGKVETNAQQASTLDPHLAEPYAASALLPGLFPGGLVEQRQMFDRALALDADDVTSNFWFGLTLLRTGYRERGLALIGHALEKEPMLPNALRWRGIMDFYAGDTARAEMYLNRARDLGLRYADRNLADIANARGDKTAAIQLFASGSASVLSTMPPGTNVAIAEGIYGDSAARTRALTLLDDYLAKPHDHIPGMIPVYLFLLGEPDKALAVEHKRLTGDTTDFQVLLWSPRGKSLRRLPEFQPFLHDFGFVDLWDKYGPPDICHKTDKGDYACE